MLLLPLVLGRATESVFVQQLDHFAPNKASPTFSQRYLVADRYYGRGGPVILYSVGERAVDEADLTEGWVMEIAKRTRGMAVLLEQRFYGHSMPTADALKGTGNVYEFLAVEQMMADIRRFMQGFAKDTLGEPLGNSTQRTPWILVGGSFAGSLMAWTKHRYPELDNAFVLASSSPMKLTDDYWQFDKVTAERLPCAELFSAAIQAIDRVLDSNDGALIQDLKTQFGLSAEATAEMLAAELSLQTSWMMQQPADQLASNQIRDFCERLQSSSSSSKAGMVRGLADISREFSSEYRVRTPLSECPAASDDRSWLWQQCTELGLWQTAPPEHKEPVWFARRLRSRRLNAAYFASRCRRCFPESLTKPSAYGRKRREFRMFADAARAAFESAGSPAHETAGRSAEYAAVFTAGDLDPWKHTFLSANLVEIRGASHAEDLLLRGADDEVKEEIARTHRVIGSAIDRWIEKKRLGGR
ncbi:hypothetical protein LPJ56_005310, partial [Coemansia sp. RSA 2599]